MSESEGPLNRKIMEGAVLEAYGELSAVDRNNKLLNLVSVHDGQILEFMPEFEAKYASETSTRMKFFAYYGDLIRAREQSQPKLTPDEELAALRDGGHGIYW